MKLALLLAGFLGLGWLASAPPPQEPAGRPLTAEEQQQRLIPWRRLDVLPEPEAQVPWQEAPAYLGRAIAAEGRIVRTHNSGRACFLNFDADWRGKFHAVIFAASFRDYPESPEKWFLNKRVRVTGKVTEHQGAPQIVIDRPEQIRVLDN